MPPSELRVSLNGKSKRRVARTNMVGIPTRTCGCHFCRSFPRRGSPKKIGVPQVQRETGVSMPTKPPHEGSSHSSSGSPKTRLGCRIRAFYLDYLWILVTAIALRLPGLCAHKRCLAIPLTSPPLADSFSTRVQFPVWFFRSYSGGCHPERAPIPATVHCGKRILFPPCKCVESGAFRKSNAI